MELGEEFQLTPSRRATQHRYNLVKLFSHFNSRPHGGRPLTAWGVAEYLHHFNSRPHGGRPLRRLHHRPISRISTHALTEGDWDLDWCSGPRPHFNSRPHGGRPWVSLTDAQSIVFQLTPSRRATNFCGSRSGFGIISTHALTEGDRNFFCIFSSIIYFNSRPHGGRHIYLITIGIESHFNSRPHGGRLQEDQRMKAA